MQQLKFKASPPKYQWKLSKREFGQYRKMYGFNVSYVDFLKQLNDLYVYYLNELGLTVNIDGSPVEKESARYMWAQLKKDFYKEPLYVWMYQKGEGEFGNIGLGTRMVFDKELAKNHQK